MNISERLVYLFGSYYQKTATEPEREELFLLLSKLSDEELSVLMDYSFTAFDVLPSVVDETKLDLIFIQAENAEVQRQNRRHRTLWAKLAVAALLLVSLGFGLYFLAQQYYQPAQVRKLTSKTKPQHDLDPGQNKAILTLGDGSVISLDDSKNGVLVNEGNVSVKKLKDGQIVYTIRSESANKQGSINKISTPRGGQFQVILPDGSHVWLNAASSISFPTAFRNSVREVEMTGEAFFDVKKGAIPFVVRNGDARIEVLGTQFNIMAYSDEKVMETTLIEGAVRFRSASLTGNLRPGQQAVLGMGRAAILNEVDLERVIAWKTGLFQFKDASVETVMRQISRWYDVEVSYEGQVPFRQFTGKISRNVKVSEVLNMLSFAGLNARIENGHIIVSP
jgi:transmembrane sensor